MDDIQRYTWDISGMLQAGAENRIKYIAEDDHISLEKALKKVSDYNERLEARIEELEDEAKQYVYKTAMNELAVKQIQAKGIEGMCKKLYNEGKSLSEFNIKEYANKLASDNEALEKGDD